MAPHDTKPGTKPAKSSARKSAPITENPLFPAVVALWFGALFGLGSLAIRVGLIEQVVLASKIDTIFASAAPPLGVSARIMLALLLAVVGALLGAWIARKIAAPKPVVRERKRGATPAEPSTQVEYRARDSHPDAPARRPISAHEELGGSGSTAGRIESGAMAGRRRSTLAIEHDETFELHETAPLPGGAWQIHAIDSAQEDALEGALDLGDFADGVPDDAVIGQFVAPPPAPGPALDWQSGATSAADRQVFQPLPAAEPAELPTEAEPLDFAPPADAMEGRQVFGMAQPQPDEVLDQLGITDAEFVDIAPVAIPVQTWPELPAEPAAVLASTDKPGMLELTEKLARSMQLRRERAAAKVAEAAIAAAVVEAPIAAEIEVPGPVPVSFEAFVTETSAEPVDAASADPESGFLHPNDIPAPKLPSLAFVADAPAMPSVFASPIEFAPAPVAVSEPAAYEHIPAALRPFAYDMGFEDDDDDVVASLLPPRSISMPPPVPPVAVEPASEDDADESQFSSLLNVVQPAVVRQDFVRIEEPADEALAIEPVVIFPGQAARLAAAETSPPPVHVPFGANAEPASFRGFDAPDSAAAGQQIAANTAAAHDAAETERALRAALANLQRMSGAA